MNFALLDQALWDELRKRMGPDELVQIVAIMTMAPEEIGACDQVRTGAPQNVVRVPNGSLTPTHGTLTILI